MDASDQEIRAVVLALIYICLIFFYGFFIVQIKSIFQLKAINYTKRNCVIEICIIYGIAMIIDVILQFIIIVWS